MTNTPKTEVKQYNKFLGWLQTFALVFIVWLVMSGRFDLKFILFGLFSSAAIATLCIRVLIVGGLKTENTYFLLGINLFKFVSYFFWLLKEVVKSSIDVSKAVFDPERVDASIVWFKADYDNPLARALLANSITMTPGTITIDIYEEGLYSVNAVTVGAREGLIDGTMQQKVAKVFGEEIDYKVIEVVDKDEKGE